jgi:hypothetical protein
VAARETAGAFVAHAAMRANALSLGHRCILGVDVRSLGNELADAAKLACTRWRTVSPRCGGGTGSRRHGGYGEAGLRDSNICA